MNAVAKKIAQASSLFFFAFFLFFRDKEERSGKYVAQASVDFFFCAGPRRQDAAGEQLALYMFSHYEYILTKLNWTELSYTKLQALGDMMGLASDELLLQRSDR